MTIGVSLRIRQLGRSGLSVSEVGLGCNNFGVRCDFDRTKEVVYAARDAGITLFDTADIYGGAGGSETLLGRILPEFRDEIVLATKFGMPMGTKDRARGSRRYIVSAVEASLRRLQTDRIDLYQMHEPDANTPIDETLMALDDLIHAGKVLYIGSSNFSGWQITEAEYVARSLGVNRMVSAQNEYSLLKREVEHEVIPAAQHFEIGVLPFYPLASGALTGKVKRETGAPPGSRLASRPEAVAQINFTMVEALEEFASSRSMTLLDLAFAFLLAESTVSSVIAGATSSEQIKANVATQSVELSDEDLEDLGRILGPGTPLG